MKNPYIERDLEAKINKYLKLPQIIAIVGPRRSGKTTLLKNLSGKMKDCLYLSFEDQKILEIFDRDIENFAKIYLKKYKYLILDEFHYAKAGGKNLKYLFDFYPGHKVLVSGSSALEITIKAIKHLVGRVVVFQLLPFCFSEFIKAKAPDFFPIYQEFKQKIIKKKNLVITDVLINNFNQYLEEYLIFGGYPEVVIAKDIEIKKTLLNQIYSLYFLKEVRDILGLIDDYKLKQLIKALSLQIGRLCQYNELSQLSSFSLPTLKKYLNFLEKTFIAFFPKPFFTNKRTELVKNPKVYFFDFGFRNTVIDNFIAVDKRNDRGELLENFIALNLSQEKTPNFWRTKAKAEVDFVIEKEGEIIPIEVKLKLEKPKISISYLNFIKKYQPRTGYVYSLNILGQIKINKTTVFYIPIFLI